MVKIMKQWPGPINPTFNRKLADYAGSLDKSGVAEYKAATLKGGSFNSQPSPKQHRSGHPGISPSRK
jgi:hypothetical protein